MKRGDKGCWLGVGLSVCLALFLLSCGGGGGGGGGGTPPDGTLPDTTPPTVVGTTPAAGATNVAVNSALIITFSEAIDPATLTPAAIRLVTADSTPISGTISYSSLTAVFTPSSQLDFASSYTLVLSAAVKDLAGNSLAGEYTCTFTTGDVPDLTPPSVVSTVPAAGAADVAINSSISVTFSEAMDPATINTSSFFLKDSSNISAPGVISFLGTTATFTPSTELEFSTNYTIEVAAEVTDLAGNGLGNAYTWSFTTRAPSIQTFTLTVTSSGMGTGSITSTPLGIDCGSDCIEKYAEGTSITLTAAPQAGFVFEGFSGGCSSIKPTCTLTLTADTAVTAVMNVASASAAGNQLGLDGGDQVAVHQSSSNPPVSQLDLATFTIEAWVYPLDERNMIIVSDSAYYLMIKPQPLRVEFAVMTSTGFPAFLSFSGSTKPLKLNQWNHVVGMVDGPAKILRIAVNGELSGTLSMGGVVDVGFPQTFSVGNSYPRSLGDFPFIGRIDEIRLSSVNRYGGNFTPPSLLDPDGVTVGLWHFDEAAGATSFVDSSGNGHTLTGLGGAATIAGTREVQTSENNLFYSRESLSLGQFPGPIAIGDFNYDGENDLATIPGVFAISGDEVAVFLGTGAGFFSPPAYFSTGIRGPRSSIILEDFNKDGHLDIVVPSPNTPEILILLGIGNGSFGTSAAFPARASLSALGAGDFDGDGNPDLVIASRDINSVSILLGTGTGAFIAPVDFDVGSYPSSLVLGDFNVDGKLDLAVANRDSNSLTILLGTGTGSFETSSDFSVGSNPTSLGVGDINGDDLLDIAVVCGTGSGFDDSVFILFGTGTGTFTLSDAFAVPRSGRMAVVDINHDGNLDLVVAATTSSYPEFYILLGDGTGSFGSPVTYYTGGEGAVSMAIDDLNGDGKADLAVGAWGDHFPQVQVYIAR